MHLAHTPERKVVKKGGLRMALHNLHQPHNLQKAHRKSGRGRHSGRH